MQLDLYRPVRGTTAVPGFRPAGRLLGGCKMTPRIPVHDPPAEDRSGAAPAGADPPPAERPPRPSDMRLLHVWKPPGLASRYRVDFFNTFARGPTSRRVCQRSIVVDAACCAEEAREIAKARFAELEGVRDWHIHAAEIEIVALADEPAADANAVQRPAGPVAAQAKRGIRTGRS